MSDQRLNASRVLRIVFSDTIPIPNISTLFVTGTAGATTIGKLVDTTKDFIALGVSVGNIIYNTTDNTAATVTAVDSATVLSVSADVFALGEAYKIFAEADKGGCTFLVDSNGTTGIVKVLTSGKDEVILQGLQNGQVVPIQILKIFATTTTVTIAHALW